MLTVNEEVPMRIAFAVLASIVTMALAMPVLAQGFAGCPPGLAVRGDGCLPPGQAKKMRRGHHEHYEPPPVSGYSPPMAYVPPYPRDYYGQSGGYSDYSRPSGGSLNIGVTVPLQ
jgi:hypothetical protein